MKTKNFLVAGIVGGIVHFLLGWVFYGMLFKDFFPESPEMATNTYVLIFLGCLTYALFIAYVFTKWAQISTGATGAKAGAIIGLFLGLYWNLFCLAFEMGITYQLAALDTAICVVSSAITGAVIGMVNGKMGD